MAPFASSVKQKPSERDTGKNWLSCSFQVTPFLPGLIVGFLLGLFVELPKTRELGGQPINTNISKKKKSRQTVTASTDMSEELKMVFVVRQDLKMGGGKIASQCAHAAVGIFSELMNTQRSLLRRWEDYGQPKIVVTCKNQQEMKELKAKAEKIGLPTFTVADAGRTQVSAGAKTVLAIGPGTKTAVDSVTRHLRLL